MKCGGVLVEDLRTPLLQREFVLWTHLFQRKNDEVRLKGVYYTPLL
jgi:hypothetical protein